MMNAILVRGMLVLSGTIALGVGIGVLFFPHSFHATAGLSLGDDVNLLNEMRAPGGLLILSGVVILSGAVKSSMTFFAMALSATVYLAFGLSRVVSLVLDGLPNSAVIQIMTLELLIGAICVLFLKPSRTQNSTELRSLKAHS